SSVLFPVLGRAGVGDKLTVLFQSSPEEKRFRDVFVCGLSTALSPCQDARVSVPRLLKNTYGWVTGSCGASSSLMAESVALLEGLKGYTDAPFAVI
ncbi:hypothetical protein B296_00015514, partial [Ensete ventricosum]